MLQEPVETIRAAIATIDTAHDEAVAAVNSASDPTTAFAAANELSAHMHKLAESDAELRGHLASRIWDTNKLSLAGLADRVAMPSKRADQKATGSEADEDPEV